jgi:hypothetical protein
MLAAKKYGMARKSGIVADITSTKHVNEINMILQGREYLITLSPP